MAKPASVSIVEPVVPGGLEPSTLAFKVYESVRRGILSGALQPGEPVSRRRIATELQTSPLPVASAFQRLEFEGLLESRPRAGTRVRTLSLDDVRGHFVVREALETQVATRVALMASARELDHLRKLARELDELGSQADVRQYSSLHRGFHRQLAACCRCPALHDAVDQCHAFAMLWLSQARPCSPGARHQELVEAIASGEPAKAARAAAHHLAFGMTRAVESLALAGDRRADPSFRRGHRRAPSAQAEREA
jgi:DNA-binding GntR family transcriptional regulator